MNRRTLLVLLTLLSLPAGEWLVLAERTPLRARLAAAAPAPADANTRATTLALRDADIAFYARRAEEDPWSAADRAQLAGLWLQRGRESGDPENFRQAERAARSSVTLREGHNGKARLVLASSLLALHRFAEAHEIARDLVRDDPDIVGYRALLAEIQLELGRYEEAGASFDTLYAARRDLAVAPRLARWLEIRGEPARARRILDDALATAQARSDLPAEQRAWFYLRVGDLALRQGRLRDAGRALRAGLEAQPDDGRLIVARARLAALRGNARETLRLVRRAGARADLAALALAGDACLQLGDSVQAEAYFAQVESGHAANPEPFARQWSQYRVDHARRLPETVALLRAEIRSRPDVLGWDLLAWALYQSGRYVEARAAATQALRMNTQDASMLFHAGMIEHALGDDVRARERLEAALRINARFHPDHPAVARRVLRQIG
jgi:tetratricopeptide (TPR) repeat protein